jgi:hypothetical protein
MRVNLLTQSSVPSTYRGGAIPVSLTIKPACGLPGDYAYNTDLNTLLRMLRKETDLSASVLKRFEGELYTTSKAKLPAVDLSERVLTDIGYFID